MYLSLSGTRSPFSLIPGCLFLLPCRYLVNQNVRCRDFPGGPRVKNPTCNAGDAGSIPG